MPVWCGEGTNAGCTWRGQADGYGATDIYSASLPPGAPLFTAGWKLSRHPAGNLEPVAGRTLSRAWDAGGDGIARRYVRGWDPPKANGSNGSTMRDAADNLWGPYTIGFLEWDGNRWVDRPEAVLMPPTRTGNTAASTSQTYLSRWQMEDVVRRRVKPGRLSCARLRGKLEMASPVGASTRSLRRPEMKMFDFCVRQRGHDFHAIFARVWVAQGAPPPDTGLWWCRADSPSSNLSHWSQPIQIMTAADRGWHSGPWKPSFQFDRDSGQRALLFFDGLYRTNDPGPFPFAFTLGCADLSLPPQSS